MLMGIYKIENISNKGLYIGSSISINSRWNTHLRELDNNTHHSSKLQKDYNIYGATYFTFSIVELVPNKEKLIEREQFWIDYFDATSINNYNMQNCGLQNKAFMQKAYEDTVCIPIEVILNNKLTSKQYDVLSIIFNNYVFDKENSEFNISDYIKYYQTDTSNIYRDYKKAITSITNETLLNNTNLFNKVDYIDKYGIVNYEFDTDIGLSQYKLANYRLKDFFILNSIYSKKLLALLSVSKVKEVYEFDIFAELMDKSTSYSHNAFCKYVLDMAINEINTKLNSDVKYNIIKRGRKFTHIEILKGNKF